jgi:hypothetical protein
VTASARFRAHARRKTRLTGILACARLSLRADVEVTDIALGGACVRFADALAVGDRVTIGLVFPTRWDPVAMPARIVWLDPDGEGERGRAGMAFEPTEPRAALALYALLGALEQDA